MQTAPGRQLRRGLAAAALVAMCAGLVSCASGEEAASPEPRVSQADNGGGLVDRAEKATRSPARAKPGGFTGEFSTMDELQRCKAGPNVVVCASILSGQKVTLGPRGADYKGEVATGFPSPKPLGLGNSITTASGIGCENTSRGIECYRGGHGFVIGDSAVVVLRGPSEERFEPTEPEPEPEPEPEIVPSPDPYEPDPYEGEPYDDGGSGCDPNYEGACVPSVPHDLDCGDVWETDFYSVGNDPHGFDGDYDGIACETY